ncbi:MAG: Rieske (2Fe-2S) protein [Actinobacteria bacterium]|nr:Rieske (2Fe-2S) protein [Actinomycetota bacterium]
MNARRVADFVDALLHNRRPKPFTPAADDVEAMRAAIALREAQPGAALPDPEFVAGLHHKLAEQLDAGAVAGEVEDRHPAFTRRRWIAGIGAVAAAAAAGAIVDHELLGSPGGGTAQQAYLEPTQATRQAVVPASELHPGAVARFATPSTVAFVVHDAGGLRAVSGVCTHQGCLLQASAGGDRLDCPCHRAAFDLEGNVLHHQFPTPLAPLPRLRVRTRDGNVEVLAPPPV